MWKSDPCYEAHGVDGSDCSFIMYLSEVRWLFYDVPQRGLCDSFIVYLFEVSWRVYFVL